MTKQSSQQWSLITAFVLAGLGVLIPFWPLLGLCVVLLALSGRFMWAIGLGLLLDMVYGVPPGLFAHLYFPFTLAALLALLLARVSSRYMIDRYSRQGL